RRIETPLLGAEAYAGNAKPENFGLLLRRELALQPDKASPALELVIGLFVIDFGQDRRKLFDCLIGIDDVARLGEKRSRLDVGRQDSAIAVHYVGARCGDTAGWRAGRFRILEAEPGQPPRNGCIDQQEHRHRHDDARPYPAAARLARAVDNDCVVVRHVLAPEKPRQPRQPAEGASHCTAPVMVGSCPLAAMPSGGSAVSSSMVSGGRTGSSSSLTNCRGSTGSTSSWDL